MAAAIDWIGRAQRATGGAGISKGYDLIRRRWSPWYPETTGYTIPTLLNAARILDRPDVEAIASGLADHLLKAATPDGGVGHWAARDGDPIVFDTGQVMFGWIAIFDATQHARYLQAATRAGDWLVSIQAESGAWNTHQHLGITKVIDTRVAWALLELYGRTHQSAYCQAAIRNLDWALAHQDADGWFHHCAFSPRADPFTHTLAYTAEGLFEAGRLLNEDRYIDAARRTADALQARLRSDGSLASTYGVRWRPTSHSSCLTGNCQMARLWLRLYTSERAAAYLDSATRALSFVCRQQDLVSANPNKRGAIPGSAPIWGHYERFKYPNWATKFFIDALLTLDCVERACDQLIYAG